MKRRFLWITLLGSLAGCTVGPDYVKPAVETPPRWHAGAGARSFSVGRVEWWKSFRDSELDRLIAEAVGANLDLKKAAGRIAEVRSQVVSATAAGLPSLALAQTTTRRLNSFSGGGAGFINTPGGSRISQIFQAGFDASWEIDLFGSVQRSVEAAEAAASAEQENLRDIQVTLVGEVARHYIELRANQHRAAVTRAHLAVQTETLDLIRERHRMGLASELDVARQESQLANTRALLPGYEAAGQQAMHALALLQGRAPGALAGRLEATGGIPLPADEPWVALPSELLRRRPDIRRAERELAAATAEVGVAVADLYPKINLSAALGLQNIRISDFTPLGKSWSMASSLSLPLFNWGKLKANVAGKEAKQEQALFAYQSTVLSAFKEVEDALVGYVSERARQASLAEAVSASQRAVDLANDRYRRGLTAFLDVLQAQQTLFQDQSSLVDSEARVSAQVVALYKAMGGEWERR